MARVEITSCVELSNQFRQKLGVFVADGDIDSKNQAGNSAGKREMVHDQAPSLGKIILWYVWVSIAILEHS